MKQVSGYGRQASGFLAAILLAASPGALQAQATPGPTLAEARKALEAAMASAAKIKVTLACVVVDSRADAVALERMDGARFFTVDVATGKARASAMFGQPSGALANLSSMGIDRVVDGRIIFLQGAVPIARKGQNVGAIGCSGASAAQDEEAAKAGAATIQ